MCKGYLVARYGVGDIISSLFLETNYGERNPTALLLPRLQEALRIGFLSEAAVVMESYTSTAQQIFEALPFPLRVVNSREMLEGTWHELLREAPPGFSELNVEGPLAFPTRQPKVFSTSTPGDFCLFCDMASELGRCNANHLQYHLIKGCTRLPILKVGSMRDWHSEIPPRADLGLIGDDDMDLYRQTTLPETAWLAQRARVIVSAITFMRCFPSLFGVPVIEICEDDRISQGTLNRTTREYAGKEYGLNALNKWFRFPSEHRQLEAELWKFRI
jgi:hypothetical protein